MKPGRIPEPTKLKILRGNPGCRALNQLEPTPRTDTPRCPRWLDKDARTKWRQLIPELKRMGVLTIVDGDALAAYCQIWARWKEAELFIQKHGPVVAIKHKDGSLKYLQQVPQVAIARTLLQLLNRFQQEFGMTPASRSRIEVPESRAGDEYERFLKGKSG